MERHIEHLVAFLSRRMEQCSDFGGLVDGELRRAAQGAATVPFYPGKDTTTGVGETHNYLATRRESAPDQLVFAPQRDDEAVINDGDPITQPLCLFHVMSRVNHRHSIASQLFDHLKDAEP